MLSWLLQQNLLRASGEDAGDAAEKTEVSAAWRQTCAPEAYGGLEATFGNQMTYFVPPNP